MGKRVESGVVQFGDGDWPGVFIRGDHALGYAMAIEDALNTPSLSGITCIQLDGLRRLLRDCQHSQDHTVVPWIPEDN